MIFRFFSSKWITGSLNSLIETAPLVLSGSEVPILILSGPFESGKSTAIDAVVSSLFSNEIFSENLTILTDIKDTTEEDPISIISTINSSITSSISSLSSNFTTTNKQDLLTIISTYAKKLSIYEKENKNPNKTQNLEILNTKLENYSKILKIKDLTSESFLHIVENLNIFEAYDFIVFAIMISEMEEVYGEDSAEMMIKILNVLNEYCLENNQPSVIIRLNDTHLFYRNEILKEFYTNLAYNIIKNRNIPCVLEGASQFESTLLLLADNRDSISWFHVEDYTKKEAFDVWTEDNKDLNERDKELLWELSYGNAGLVHNFSAALEEKGVSLAELQKTVWENALNSVNSYFNSLNRIEEELSIKERLLGQSKLPLRSTLYMLKQLSLEKNQEISVEHSDFSTNPVMQELVIQRLLSYNAVNKVLKFDKGFLPKVLEASSYWKYTSSWTEMKRNKYAYDKICST